VSQEIFLEEDEPRIVTKMVDFLYSLDYDDHRQDETAVEEPPLVVNAKVYIIADKYNIQSLKEWAVTKYNELLPVTWNNTSFAESARIILENTLESDFMLREVIIRKASDHAKVLLDRGEFVALLQSHGHFAAEVLKGVLFKQTDDIEVDLWGMGTGKKIKKRDLY
jgi:hypothetical protein